MVTKIFVKANHLTEWSSVDLLEDIFELATQFLDHDESLIGFSIWRDREMVALVPRGSELIELLRRLKRVSWMRVCHLELEMQSAERRS